MMWHQIPTSATHAGFSRTILTLWPIAYAESQCVCVRGTIPERSKHMRYQHPWSIECNKHRWEAFRSFPMYSDSTWSNNDILKHFVGNGMVGSSVQGLIYTPT